MTEASQLCRSVSALNKTTQKDEECLCRISARGERQGADGSYFQELMTRCPPAHLPGDPRLALNPAPKAQHQEAETHGKDTVVEICCFCNKQQDRISISERVDTKTHQIQRNPQYMFPIILGGCWIDGQMDGWKVGRQVGRREGRKGGREKEDNTLTLPYP